MYCSKKEDKRIPCSFPNNNKNKINNIMLADEYFNHLKFFLVKEKVVKTMIAPIIIYEAGVCFEKNASPKNIGNSAQYTFFSFFIAKIKK